MCSSYLLLAGGTTIVVLHFAGGEKSTVRKWKLNTPPTKINAITAFPAPKTRRARSSRIVSNPPSHPPASAVQGARLVQAISQSLERYKLLYTGMRCYSSP
eukprot:6578649-Pyramimonas_sp.AAC.1